MSRKRKGRRHLNMYQVFGAHLLLFLGIVIVVVLATPAELLPNTFIGGSIDNTLNGTLFQIFSSWILAFYLHAGYVICVTIYRLLRRLLYEQPQRERLRDEKIDRLLDEVAELREALRGTGLVYAPSNSEGRAERLVEKASHADGELNFAEEAETEADIRLN